MKIIIEFFLLILILTSAVSAGPFDNSGSTKTPEEDQIKIAGQNQSCHIINKLLVKKEFGVECFSNYQHYGPTSKNLRANGMLRIAGYNLLHPGTSKSLFKDYSLIAKIMNNFDVVSSLEVLGTLGHDEVNNQAVLTLLRSSPQMLERLKVLKKKMTDPVKQKEIDTKITKLINDTNRAYSLYRAPGYFKILVALKKLDPSWALILAPLGDSALQGSVEEMVGFFYRANSVTPDLNRHCSEYRDSNGGVPYACLLNLSSQFMDKNYTHYFARRPFMASFTAGNLRFALVSMHVVYTFSGNEEIQKKMLNDVFEVDSPSALGEGVNESNFARFAEVKMTLNFMDRFRKKYNDNNIMLVSDTNLVATNPYWSEILKSFPGGSLFINEPSTISPQRYTSEGKETFGVANSYDHFIFAKSTFPGCDEGRVFNYYNSSIQADVERMYVIRPTSLYHKGLPSREDGGLKGGDIPPDDSPTPSKLDYPITKAGQAKVDLWIKSYSALLSRTYTVVNNEVVLDTFQAQERIDGFKRRVFTNQLTNAYYYRFYQEILSDHFPVSINCKI